MADLDARIAISAHLDGDFSKSVARARSELAALDRAVDRPGQRAEVGELAAEYRELGRRADRAMDQAAGGAREATAALGAQERAVGRVRRSLAAGVGGGGAGGLGALGALASGAAVAAAGRRAVDAIGEAMDTRQLRVRMRLALNSDDAEADAERLAQRAWSGLDRGLFAEESELLEAQIKLSGAGIAASSVGAISETAHKVAFVTRGQLLDVSTAMGQAFNLFGDQFTGTIEEKAALVGDIFAAVQKEEDLASFTGLGQGLKNAAGPAKNMKLEFRDLVRLVGVLNTLGVTDSEAGTALAGSLREIPKAAKEAGVAVARFEDGSLDYVGTLRRIDATMDGLNTDQRTLRLAEMFGETAQMAVTPFLGVLDQLEEKLARDPLGIVERDMGEYLDDASGRFDIATAKLERAKDTFAELLSGSAEGLIDPVSDAASAAAAYARENPEAQDALDAALGRGGRGALAVGALALGAKAAGWLGGKAALARFGPWGAAAALGPDLLEFLATGETASGDRPGHWLMDFHRAANPDALSAEEFIAAGRARARLGAVGRRALQESRPGFVGPRLPAGFEGTRDFVGPLPWFEEPRAAAGVPPAGFEEPRAAAGVPPAGFEGTRNVKIEIAPGAIPIQVDARGMSPEEAQDAVAEGVRSGLDDAGRTAGTLMADVIPEH